MMAKYPLRTYALGLLVELKKCFINQYRDVFILQIYKMKDKNYDD